MKAGLVALFAIATCGAFSSAIAQNALTTPPTGQSTAPTPMVLQEACSGDVAQSCSGATSASAQSQCLQSNQATVSEACQAALAQTPAPGTPKHLGFDPAPVAPPAPQPVNLPNFTAPPAPVATVTQATPSPTSQPRYPATVVLAPPPSAGSTGPLPVNPTSNTQNISQ
jgi:hypothetical protein